MAEYKLRAADSLREVEMIRQLGVEFRFGVEIDSAAALEALEAEFDFIFLGVGLGAMQRLNIPGEDTQGRDECAGADCRLQDRTSRELHGTVVVVGAGNTAIDAANAARRLGAETVYLLYRRSESDMSAFDFEYEHAKQEGVQFLWRRQPLAIRAEAHGRLLLDTVQVQQVDRQARADSGFAVHHRRATWWCRPSGSRRWRELMQELRGVEVRDGRIVADRAIGADGQSALLCRRRLRERRARSGGCGGRRQARGPGDAENCGGGPCLTFACGILPAGSTRRIRSGWPRRRRPTAGEQIMRAFDAGWGGAVWKTIGEPVTNVSSRYSATDWNGQRIMGFNNIELISDRHRGSRICARWRR